MNKIAMTVLAVLAVFICASSAADLILALRREGKGFEEAYHGLEEELSPDFKTAEHIIDKRCSVEELAGLIRRYNPKLVVLMDNTAIALFRKYQSTLDSDDYVIPSISIMGIMIGEAISGMRNACGISYEIPLVTSIVNLRSVLGKPVRRVGVVHREFLKGFIEYNSNFCKRENIEIVNVSLPDKSDSYARQIKEAFEQFEGVEIDALWVPNDNMLLQADLIKNVWSHFVPKYRVPVIVGVEMLVNPKLNFGTFAVLPDHISLGNQAAAMVYDIRDNGWKCTEIRVDPPIAVYKIINLLQAKKVFNVSDERLKSVDKKLK